MFLFLCGKTCHIKEVFTLSVFSSLDFYLVKFSSIFDRFSSIFCRFSMVEIFFSTFHPLLSEIKPSVILFIVRVWSPGLTDESWLSSSAQRGNNKVLFKPNELIIRCAMT